MRFIFALLLVTGCGSAPMRSTHVALQGDADGVARDRCANVGANHDDTCPGSGSVDPDPDGDGIRGGADACPTLPAPRSSNGCPIQEVESAI